MIPPRLRNFTRQRAAFVSSYSTTVPFALSIFITHESPITHSNPARSCNAGSLTIGSAAHICQPDRHRLSLQLRADQRGYLVPVRSRSGNRSTAGDVLPFRDDRRRLL